MAKLVKITKDTPNAIPVWGFHGSCTVDDVAAALKVIGVSLVGSDNVINIMSGTHGYCSGQVGAVASREVKFAEEDRSLVQPKTKDNKPIVVDVHDFNNNHLEAPDYVTAAMSKLNSDMREIVSSTNAKHVFLLAYCCSAGTE